MSIGRLKNVQLISAKRNSIITYYFSFFTFRNQILSYNETRNGTDNKVAFVVPAFDGARNVVGSILIFK